MFKGEPLLTSFEEIPAMNDKSLERLNTYGRRPIVRVKTKLSMELGVREHDKQLRTQQVSQKMAASALFRFLSFELAF